MYALMDLLARMRGEPESVHDSLKRRFSTACSGVDGGQVIPHIAYSEWYSLAARQGDAYAKVKVASMNSADLKSGDYRMIASDVALSADPEALFELGDLLALAPEGEDVGNFNAVDSAFRSYAMSIVACRMGADCGESSYRLDAMCINLGVCAKGDYESVVRDQLVPAGQSERLDRAIDAVQNVVGK
jgi:hypothetical protein